MKVKQNVDQILIAPRDLQLVLRVQRLNVLGPLELTHSRQIHQHYARVDAERSVERMSCKSIVPAHVLVLVLRRQGGHLRGIEVLELRPDALDGRQEQRVRVHVQNGIDVLEDGLRDSCTLLYSVSTDIIYEIFSPAGRDAAMRTA